MMRSSAHRIALPFILCTFLLGCAARQINPSFSVTENEADHDLKRMAKSPKRLDRPLVIVGGFMDVGVVPWSLKQRLAAITGDDRIVAVAIGDCPNLDNCRRRIVDAVNRSFPILPESAPATGAIVGAQTVEVDVIGCSLGGLAARFAAMPDVNPAQSRLNVVRLFTVSSPLRGSSLADEMPLLHPIQKEVRPGSALLEQIEAEPSDYEIDSYVRLGDKIIGPGNAAAPGRIAWWVDTPPFEDPHNGAFSDPRILSDIARRLRGERPFTIEPPAPPPGPW